MTTVSGHDRAPLAISLVIRGRCTAQSGTHGAVIFDARIGTAAASWPSEGAAPRAATLVVTGISPLSPAAWAARHGRSHPACRLGHSARSPWRAPRSHHHLTPADSGSASSDWYETEPLTARAPRCPRCSLLPFTSGWFRRESEGVQARARLGGRIRAANGGLPAAIAHGWPGGSRLRPCPLAYQMLDTQPALPTTLRHANRPKRDMIMTQSRGMSRADGRPGPRRPGWDTRRGSQACHDDHAHR